MTLPDFLTQGPKGEIRLTGHRIDLYLIVLFYNEGHTSEMLHDEYPTLPLDLIHKVLAFYFENTGRGGRLRGGSGVDDRATSRQLSAWAGDSPNAQT